MALAQSQPLLATAAAAVELVQAHPQQVARQPALTWPQADELLHLQREKAILWQAPLLRYRVSGWDHTGTVLLFRHYVADISA